MAAAVWRIPSRCWPARADPALELALSVPAMLRRDHDRAGGTAARALDLPARRSAPTRDSTAVRARRRCDPGEACGRARCRRWAPRPAAVQLRTCSLLEGSQATRCARRAAGPGRRPWRWRGHGGARAEGTSESASPRDATRRESALPPILRAPNRSWPPVRLEPGLYRESIAGPAAAGHRRALTRRGFLHGGPARGWTGMAGREPRWRSIPLHRHPTRTAGCEPAST